jgi:hypothetical protein
MMLFSLSFFFFGISLSVIKQIVEEEYRSSNRMLTQIVSEIEIMTE